MTDPLSFVKTPPTDSLYKFMAISGLLVMILTALVFQYASYKIYIKDYDVSKDSLRYSQIEELMDKEKEKIDKFLDDWKRIEESSKDNIMSQSYINKLDSTYRRFTKSYENYQAVQLDYKAKYSERDLTREIIRKYRNVASIVFVISFFVMIAGFILWYFNIQRYQDIILKAEAKRLSDNCISINKWKKPDRLTLISILVIITFLLVLFFKYISN